MVMASPVHALFSIGVISLHSTFTIKVEYYYVCGKFFSKGMSHPIAR
jgi:hypothetical protein